MTKKKKLFLLVVKCYFAKTKAQSSTDSKCHVKSLSKSSNSNSSTNSITRISPIDDRSHFIANNIKPSTPVVQAAAKSALPQNETAASAKQEPQAQSSGIDSEYVQELKAQLENLKNEMNRLHSAQSNLEKSLKETTSIFKPIVLSDFSQDVAIDTEQLLNQYSLEQYLSSANFISAAAAAFPGPQVRTAGASDGLEEQLLLNDKVIFFFEE